MTTSDNDRRDLARGATVNLVGNLFKLADPVLLVAVAATYGAEAFGLFFVAQAIVLLLLRVALLGLDKAMLWWIPREQGFAPTPLLRRAATVSVSLAVVLTAAVVGLAGPGAMEALGRPAEAATPLRLLALSLPLLVGIELTTHATMGTRRMGVNVLVKDVVQPVAFPLLALGLAALGLQSTGLAWAYLGSNALALGVAWSGMRRRFSAMPEGTDAPPGLWGYALPMWGAEVSNSLLQRIDVLLVEALTADLALVGVWGIVAKLSNSLRAIRRSFDPIVASIAADPAVAQHRLRSVMSRATVMVSALQVPVVVFLFVFVDDLLALFGGAFDSAGPPLMILATCWLFASVLGLAGVALYARGHSRLHLANILGTIVLVALLGVVLIPRFALVGAAASVAGGYLAQAVAQAIQLRVLTGVWGFDGRSVRPILVGLMALGVASSVRLGLGPWALVSTRALFVVAFGLAYGPLLFVATRSSGEPSEASTR